MQSNAVVIGKDVTSFGATDLERIAFSQPRNIEGRFPKLEDVIPSDRKSALWSVRVDPVLLANLLTTIDKLNVQSDQTSVDLDFHGKPDCVSLIVARYQDVTQKIDGAIVPLTDTEGPYKGKTDCRPRDIEESTAEFVTDDDNRLHGAKMLIEELQRKLTAAEEKAQYHRNNVEELRASDRIGAIEQVKAELWQIINERTAERDANQRQIEELQTDLENARTEQEADAESEMGKLKESLKESQGRVDYLENMLAESGYDDDLQGLVADLHKAQDKAADLDNAMAIEGVRLTTAWKRIEQLERVNGLLRSNFDRMVATMK